ncbi:hypothetical protein JK358_02010 [Nocardia sp. 2]|uniref:Uncharacterized protein n=1 Tax=Nocardia acididurans TaxID=2802282 RepID=A0ABS1M208_9NOCA|nr:hypothetical protein [Nocardia acididurans]MBL1073163.1 hypothetical protein [Nocardia acididurans]
MLEKSSPSSEFVAAMGMRIERHAAVYAEQDVHTFLQQPHRIRRHATEQPLLDLFTHHVEAVVATYDPPGIRRAGDSLVFEHIYTAVLRPAAGQPAPRATDLLTALLAAEVEFRGPLRLSRTQNRQLAETYERLGKPLVTAGLPAHAALALRRASGLYRMDEDTDAEDRCGLALARARRLAQPVAWKRVGGLFPDLVCGYGYRPFRMLAVMAVQLIIFSVAIALLSHEAVATTIYKVMVSYLNPLGPGDTEGLDKGGRVLFVLESILGTVTLSVFFALLVRRWFRL